MTHAHWKVWEDAMQVDSDIASGVKMKTTLSFCGSLSWWRKMQCVHSVYKIQYGELDEDWQQG